MTLDLSHKPVAELRLILADSTLPPKYHRAAREALKGTQPPTGPKTVVLPWKVLCSVNQRTIPANGRQVLSQKYRDRLAMAAVLAGKQWRGGAHDGPVEMRYDFHPPDNRRRDFASNWVKLIEDSLIGLSYADDSQVRSTRVEGHEPDRTNPRVEITVRGDS